MKLCFHNGSLFVIHHGEMSKLWFIFSAMSKWGKGEKNAFPFRSSLYVENTWNSLKYCYIPMTPRLGRDKQPKGLELDLPFSWKGKSLTTETKVVQNIFCIFAKRLSSQGCSCYVSRTLARSSAMVERTIFLFRFLPNQCQIAATPDTIKTHPGAAQFKVFKSSDSELRPIAVCETPL